MFFLSLERESERVREREKERERDRILHPCKGISSLLKCKNVQSNVWDLHLFLVCGCHCLSVTMWGRSSGAVKDLSDSINVFICMHFQPPLYWFIYGLRYFIVNHLNFPWQYLSELYELAGFFKFLLRSGVYSNTILAGTLVPQIQRTWKHLKTIQNSFCDYAFRVPKRYVLLV
jgi:hypothetical protein